ncbi:hypothetical protein RHMOL_Rhmol13G0229500 [Rhododendron molle]|uniref:Uncharacterized protein n=1 Tax=Rhododendron molle TaxID=49168 RepID=A0ACC0L9H0_RHOML|nr:hypothetical protein RHMOL_Rhmol13G0229500 [Rhododendron molle]
MGIPNCGFLALFFLLFCISTQSAASNLASGDFLECFHSQTNLSVSNSSSNVIFTTNSSSYASVLQSSARNQRFVTASSTPKPQLIIRPLHESHIQAAVICSRKNSINIRIRSGGHDYEGLSYVSNIPFIIIDLANLRSIKIDVENKTAWVESGATLGELYHAIAKESNIYAFPAGSCSTIGVGGHLGGGGFGTIFRKYGLAADNVIDARIVDVNGRIFDRKSMGEELFWAIRGGGAASFGIIFAWKINLVSVPSIVTVFNIGRTLEPGATKLLQKWQLVADKLSDTLFLDVVIAGNSNNTIAVSFQALFLGVSEELLTTMEESFPELGVERKDCTEMSWIQSVLHFAGFSTRKSYDVLLNRTNRYESSFKAKSDYVKEPISEKGLQGLWKILGEEESGYMIWTPYGGRMSEISEFEIPFPHRSGNLYLIQYMVTWEAEDETEEHVNWITRLYEYMTPFVSKNPRSAYLNYRDLDLGINRNENESYGQASVWGLKYFNSNFKRLAQVKTQVDPSNFFCHMSKLTIQMGTEVVHLHTEQKEGKMCMRKLGFVTGNPKFYKSLSGLAICHLQENKAAEVTQPTIKATYIAIEGWISYQRILEDCSNLEAVLWGLLRGFEMIKDQEMPVVQIINDETSPLVLRFVTALSTPKPQLIIRPLHESHIQAAVIFSRKNSINIRIRSGGYDYEGLSYVSNIPFIIIDLANLRSIKIDVENKTAWVESGATLGELYHAIAKESNIYAFPAGSCSTIGVGGHLGGGRLGTSFRKYGLAADNAIDAREIHIYNTIAVSFQALFLGVSEELLTTMEESFPELGVERKDYTEMSWIQSVLYFAGFSTRKSYDVLLNRTNRYKSSFKAKSDYVKEPISEEGLQGLWKILGEEESGYMIWTPYGGRMSEISEFEIPFPHRSGNLYLIQYMVTWEAEEETEEHVN